MQKEVILFDTYQVLWEEKRSNCERIRVAIAEFCTSFCCEAMMGLAYSAIVSRHTM